VSLASKSAESERSMTLSSWVPDQELVQDKVLDRVGPGTVLLLPDKVDEAGIALYSDTNAGLIKTARNAGVPIDFGFDVDRRKYLSEYSAGEVIATVLLGIGTNLTTDLLKHVWTVAKIKVRSILGESADEPQVDAAIVRLRIAHIEKQKDHVVAEGIEYVGPAGKITNVLSAVLQGAVENGHTANLGKQNGAAGAVSEVENAD
jgi:hypothetical protein